MDNNFRERAKTAALDRWYRKRLRAVAKQIAKIAAEWSGNDPSELQLSLFDYSVRLDEWARGVAEIMLRRAAAADYETWLNTGKKINRATKRMLRDAVGDGAVRSRHKALDKTVHAWSDPPICDVGAGGVPIRSHPGCVFNCRCWPEPIFYRKDI